MLKILGGDVASPLTGNLWYDVSPELSNKTNNSIGRSPELIIFQNLNGI
jgi:hypothetical protein